MPSKISIKFECMSCGYQTIKYLGKCPNCGKWNSFEEIKEVKTRKKDLNIENEILLKKDNVNVAKLKDISTTDVPREDTG